MRRHAHSTGPNDALAAGLPAALVLAALAACNDYWPRDNPVDPYRCDPRCQVPLACRNGACVDPGADPDGGGTCTHPTVTRSCPGSGGWCQVPAGCFVMGSPPSSPCTEQPSQQQHEVVLAQGFTISSTEVTQKQYNEVMKDNPSAHAGCPACPVDSVTWHDAAAYCNELSHKEGLSRCYEPQQTPTKSCTSRSQCGPGETCALHEGARRCLALKAATSYADAKIYGCPGYRLPTEAEWEYAARAGTTGGTHGGLLNPGSCDQCAYDKTLAAVAIYCFNSESKTGTVGQKTANAWGLYDMSGNVREWCHDWWQQVPDKDRRTNPTGSVVGTTRVTRGGSFASKPRALTSAHRSHNLAPIPATNDLKEVGFRCVRTAASP